MIVCVYKQFSTFFSLSRRFNQSKFYQMESWKGKIAVVTGASLGIGKSIVLDLAKNGIKVVGLSRRVNLIEEYAKDFEEGQICAIKYDVSDLESIKKAFQLIEEKFGVIHILVNNAGIGW